jgi:hypothetical protein
MSTKGSEPRQLHRDHSKFRDNMENVTKDTRKPTVKREVAKEDLPTGIRSRIYYGEVR